MAVLMASGRQRQYEEQGFLVEEGLIDRAVVEGALAGASALDAGESPSGIDRGQPHHLRFQLAQDVAHTGPLRSWYAGRDDQRVPAETIDHPLNALIDTVDEVAGDPLHDNAMLHDLVTRSKQLIPA